jgi:hypothetical protein
MSLRTVIVRTGPPHQFDQFEYGSVCRSQDHNHDKYDLYLQVGKHEVCPQWELIGSFFHDAPQDHIDELIAMRLKKF